MTTARPPRKMTTLRRGAVLLELMLALTIFTTAALVMLGAVNAATRSTDRLGRHAQAVDLASSLMARIQLEDLDPSETQGIFEPPFDDWTYSIATDPLPVESAAANAVLLFVTVRHEPSATEASLQRWLIRPSTDDGLFDAVGDLGLDAEAGQ